MSGFKPDGPRLSRRHFLVGSGAAAAGLALYSGEISRHELEVVDITIPIRALPAPFHGFRVIQISDIHLDEFTEPLFLEHIVRRVNELKPDMVLITGDFITHGAITYMAGAPAAKRCGEILSALEAPLRYGCLGNHDVAAGAHIVMDAIGSHGIPILVNQFVPLERSGAHIWLSAINDPLTGSANLDLAIPPSPDAPVILMSHEPDYADTIATHPRGSFVDLVLSGHSHGGQVRLPVMGALILPPMATKYPEGHYRFNEMQLYVNRGLGTVGVPFRFNCPPEITVHTLQPA